MYHVHIQRKLKERWEQYYAQEFHNFHSLFGGYVDDGNWTSVLQKIYTKLTNDPEYSLKFRLGFTLGPHTYPTIAVTLREEPVDTQFIGYDTGYLGNGREYGMLVKQTATIHIIADSDLLVVALNEFVRQTIMSNLAFFESVGYIGTQFVGANDMSPAEDHFPESSGVMMRQQTWSSLYEAKTITSGNGVAVDVFVHAQDITIDGITGGIAEENN